METKKFFGLAISSIFIVLSGIGCSSKSIESAEGFAQICALEQRNRSSFAIDSSAFNILVLVVDNESEKVKKDFLNLSPECKKNIHSVIKNQRKTCDVATGNMTSIPTSNPGNICILYYVIGNRSGERSLRIKFLEFSQTRKIMNLLDL
jgi:hypothetical protein